MIPETPPAEQLKETRPLSVLRRLPRLECPACHNRAVVQLTRAMREVQTDGTTDVCHPALGGCNLGYNVSPLARYMAAVRA